MDWVEIYQAALMNLCAQWNADSEKVPSITDTSRYNQMVVHFNALASAGVMPNDIQPADIEPGISVIISNAGYTGVATIEEANAEDWGATWPVPTV